MMLKALKGYERPPVVKIGDAHPDALFEGGLEYNPPARGVWNIVHTGMLIPEAHQIFCCAQGCLRGVILTAAEMGALDRMSSISVSESDMFDGTLESSIVEGCCDILEKLDKKPPVVLLFLSCIHLFAGVDFKDVIRQLSERWKDIHFTDCYMTPTMRKTISPDAKMRCQLYEPLKAVPLDPGSVNIIGCDRPTDEESELVEIIKENGFDLRDITLCDTYEEYQQMAQASLHITYLPAAFTAGEKLAQRMGAKHLYLPNSFDFDQIEKNLSCLCEALGAALPDLEEKKQQAIKALEDTLDIVEDTKIVIDFTAVTRPFELAKLLIQRGFNVGAVINDSVSQEELSAFEWLKENRPQLEIISAVNVNMLHSPEEDHGEILAIGQKAAHYFATDNFVNIVANGGLYGFTGIVKLCELMKDACLHQKDRRTLISHKGIGCYSCLEG